MSLVDVTSDQFRSRLRPFGISFEKSLSDLIKCIRTYNDDKQKLSQFFNNSIQECRNELRSNDMELKSMAILKLTYLEMYGFDLPFMNFQILEVMSSMNFQQKRIGYLAAMQILSRENNDDVLMLMTNLLKKDLNSSNHVEVGLAISCLSTIVTRDLAQDVVDDLMKMFSHSKPFIRKKAILASYKVFLKFPESLKMNYSRLVDKLDESEDLSVVSATVNVICELAKKQPSNYIELIPKLFAILTTSSNNWMIIRLLKLFSSLSLIEPRIKKKFLPAVIALMSNTNASSLKYESINCILTGNLLAPDDTKVLDFVINILLSLVVTKDQNLKYVSILAFIKIINIHPDLVKQHQELVISWLKDEDLIIRSKSLELVDGLIDKSNIMNIVSNLLIQIASDDTLPSKYKLQISEKILSLCGSKNFSMIPNFDWYLATLKDLLHLMKSDSKVMLDISQQIANLGLRVPALRLTLVEVCCELIADDGLPVNEWWNNCIWCISEYFTEYLEEQEEPEEDEANEVENFINLLIGESTYKSLISTESQGSILPVYISSVFKIFVKYINKDTDDVELWNEVYYQTLINYSKDFIKWMEQLQYSFSFAIQERSIGVCELFKLVKESLEGNLSTLKEGTSQTIPPPLILTQALPQFYNSYELKPIAQGLQQRLGVPECLEIDKVINETTFNELMTIVLLEDISDDENYFSDQLSEPEFNEHKEIDDLITVASTDEESIARRKLERIEELKYDPYYISTDKTTSKNVTNGETDEVHNEKKKKKKKRSKAEQVTILEEVDVETPYQRDLITANIHMPHQSGKLKFRMDDSQLMAFDLKNDSINDDNSGEYEVEKIRKELLSTSIENSKEGDAEKKKVKKKKKKDKLTDGGSDTVKKTKIKKRKAVIS